MGLTISITRRHPQSVAFSTVEIAEVDRINDIALADEFYNSTGCTNVPHLDRTQYHIAFVGARKCGKSSLINALRGIPDGSQEAAVVEELNTDVSVRHYSISTAPGVVLWELPAVGVPGSSEISYAADKRLGQFNLVVVVCAEVLEPNDIFLGLAASSIGVETIFLWSKSDWQLEGIRRRDRHMSLATAKQILRDEVQTRIRPQLDQSGLHSSPLYIVSAWVAQHPDSSDMQIYEKVAVQHVMSNAAAYLNAKCSQPQSPAADQRQSERIGDQIMEETHPINTGFRETSLRNPPSTPFPFENVDVDKFLTYFRGPVDPTAYNILILGESGGGKTALIAALRDSEGPPVVKFACSTKVSCFSHPRFPHIQLWEIPDQMLSDPGWLRCIAHFDALLAVFSVNLSTRLLTTPKIAQHLGVETVFIRSHSDLLLSEHQGNIVAVRHEVEQTYRPLIDQFSFPPSAPLLIVNSNAFSLQTPPEAILDERRIFTVISDVVQMRRSKLSQQDHIKKCLGLGPKDVLPVSNMLIDSAKTVFHGIDPGGFYNVAVIGDSLVGKSSLINGILARKETDPNAFAVGEVVREKNEPLSTSIPDLPTVVLWEFRHSVGYHQYLCVFDAVLLITATDRLSPLDIQCVDHLVVHMIPFLLVRNKCDAEVTAVKRRDRHMTYSTAIQLIQEGFMAQLQVSPSANRFPPDSLLLLSAQRLIDKAEPVRDELRLIPSMYNLIANRRSKATGSVKRRHSSNAEKF